MDKTFLPQKKFSLSLLLQNKFKDFFKCFDTNIPAGRHTIPPKLITITADFLIPLLTAAINKSIKENIFPDSAKVAAVVQASDLLLF